MRLLLILTLLLTSVASASERLTQAAFATTYQLDGSQLQRKNQAVLDYLWLDVYAAAFYSAIELSPRQALQQQAGQRLELYYFRDIARSDVIKAAWLTLERQHTPTELQRLRDQVDALHATFHDIRPGDRYALNYSPRNGLSLERNGSTMFRSDNAELARAYLGIWLAPDGLSDQLREQLLGER
ncbi:MAG: chalcone isomerase family protein [Pseudomonas sp.]